MAHSGAVLGLGQNLRPLFCHQDRVFELGRQASVSGSDGPIVLGVKFRESSTGVNHRLDGETHSGKQSFLTALAVGNVRDVGILMKSSTETVSDVLANDRESPLIGFFNDVIPDHTHRTTRFQSGDRAMHSIECALADRASFFANGPNQECFGLIAMPTVDNTGDVDIDDIAILQDIVAGDAMADDIIDARAATAGVSQIPKCRWRVAVLDSEIVDEAIDFAGGDTWLDEGTEVVHQLRVESSCGSHPVALDFCQLQLSQVLQHRCLEFSL